MNYLAIFLATALAVVLVVALFLAAYRSRVTAPAGANVDPPHEEPRKEDKLHVAAQEHSHSSHSHGGHGISGAAKLLIGLAAIGACIYAASWFTSLFPPARSPDPVREAKAENDKQPYIAASASTWTQWIHVPDGYDVHAWSAAGFYDIRCAYTELAPGQLADPDFGCTYSVRTDGKHMHWVSFKRSRLEQRYHQL